MDWSNDSCPICNGQAKEALPRMGDLAEILCSECGRYRVSGTALEVIRHEDRQTRDAALAAAKARAVTDKNIPKIVYDDLRNE